VKLMRIGPPGAERPAALDADGVPRDLSALTADIGPTLLADPDALAAVRDAVNGGGLPALPADAADTDSARIGAPLAGIGKIVCIGLNYRDHAAETGATLPDEPVMFLKTPDTVVGPYDQVHIPRGSTHTDWEVELAVVIGRTARYLGDPEDARDVIAGYAISNDVSEREYQLHRGGQWDKGKNCETFNPLGPYLVTADEVPDPQALGLRLSVNGVVRQRAGTEQMVFGVFHLVHYLSQFMVLRPGDVINTGTPAGVALATDGPYLAAGDVVELEIDGLGRSRQTFVAAP
jgi:2-keto-4-pentenoate hydratase/2-oxohepta-3-ene-1,7-dioic acid hydratase in catechol pathway